MSGNDKINAWFKKIRYMFWNDKINGLKRFRIIAKIPPQNQKNENSKTPERTWRITESYPNKLLLYTHFYWKKNLPYF